MGIFTFFTLTNIRYLVVVFGWKSIKFEWRRLVNQPIGFINVAPTIVCLKKPAAILLTHSFIINSKHKPFKPDYT